MTQIPRTIFRSRFTVNLVSVGPVVSDKMMFENVDLRTDDGCLAILEAHL